jgi:hypothetical protein
VGLPRPGQAVLVLIHPPPSVDVQQATDPVLAGYLNRPDDPDLGNPAPTLPAGLTGIGRSPPQSSTRQARIGRAMPGRSAKRHLPQDGAEPAGTRWVHTRPAARESIGHQRSRWAARNRR